MKRETSKRLHDVLGACVEIEQFSLGEDLESFLGNRQFHLSVHKLLENVGEALNQLSKTDSDVAELIPELRRFVNLRNQITHGYDSVNYSIVWQVATEQIPSLKICVEGLLKDA